MSEGASTPGAAIGAVILQDRVTLVVADPGGGIFAIAGRSHQFRIRILAKIVVTPSVPVTTMIANLKLLYDTAGIAVQIGPQENLTIQPNPNAPAQTIFNVGTCNRAQTPTADQTLLFANRNNAGPTDIVVYFVQGTMPPNNGCAAFPAGQPGAIIAQGASQWTVAHEVGHVLGLSHIDGEHQGCPQVMPQCCSTPDFTRLMTGCSTSNIAGTPSIVQSEIETMQGSDFTHQEVT